MAAAQSAQGQPAPLNDAIPAEGLYGIFRTRRLKSAYRGSPPRNVPLISTYNEDKNVPHNGILSKYKKMPPAGIA
jgi:hypothetical protein